MNSLLIFVTMKTTSQLWKNHIIKYFSEFFFFGSFQSEIYPSTRWNWAWETGDHSQAGGRIRSVIGKGYRTKFPTAECRVRWLESFVIKATDLKIAIRSNTNPFDYLHENHLRCSIKPLDRSGHRFGLLNDCIAKTRQCDSFEIANIFQIESDYSDAKFTTKVPNHCYLYHSTFANNIFGILQKTENREKLYFYNRYVIRKTDQVRVDYIVEFKKKKWKSFAESGFG